MAALPQNNLREQLRLHSARGALTALRAPGPPRDRPPGFTFKKARGGSAAASVLRDKDVNTSLAAPAAPPAGKAPACGSEPPRSTGSAAPAGKAGPGPAVTIGDEWDDIDDFDLSGIERFWRPPFLPPKGPRAPGKAGPEPPGCGGPAGAEAPPEAEPRPLSQRSVICLEDSPPGLALDEDTAEPHPAAGAEGVGGQEPRGAGNSPPELEEAVGPLAGNELEEDELDIIPPSPEEELPPFSPSVQSIR
ncbi:basic proline-rich protein-like [Empidonax traillii]|uniref:basic proline-rich protein-like n=1 Tax=Empidonax traillii TaxID=164674 RepID=UPI000FFD2297|nr:basic proline-rich protein-like [Empidonax traillii]